MKPLQNKRVNAPLSRGFSLLEVLIALVILSIGLLGVAALQGVGIRSSQGAYLTSQASLLAYDVADRIRANPSMLPLGTTATAENACEADLDGLGLAELDWAEWSCAVESLLPNGSGAITRVASALIAGASTYTIDIAWQDLQTEDPDDQWTYQMVIEL